MLIGPILLLYLPRLNLIKSILLINLSHQKPEKVNISLKNESEKYGPIGILRVVVMHYIRLNAFEVCDLRKREEIFPLRTMLVFSQIAEVQI